MTVIRWSIRLFAVTVAAVLMLYLVRDPERRILDDAARAEAPGKFIRLADGVTHYEVAGPDTGRVVLFASAFSVPAFISDPLFQALADSGFRVIRFDYFGRGWSDRPNVEYDQWLFVRQMAGLLDSLGVSMPVTLVSVSHGAAMITSFADRYPGRCGHFLSRSPPRVGCALPGSTAIQGNPGSLAAPPGRDRIGARPAGTAASGGIIAPSGSRHLGTSGSGRAVQREPGYHECCSTRCPDSDRFRRPHVAR